VKFLLDNSNIHISKLIDFGFIKLIYQLNNDIIDNIDFYQIDDNTIQATIIIKHFFKDIGISQKYLYITIHKKIIDNCIEFNAIPISDSSPDNVPIESEVMRIQNFTTKCYCLSPNSIYFEIHILFENNVTIPIVAENLIGPIVFKIFKRIKQFIDNLK
jgi:hypothetical protein